MNEKSLLLFYFCLLFQVTRTYTQFWIDHVCRIGKVLLADALTTALSKYGSQVIVKDLGKIAETGPFYQEVSMMALLGGRKNIAKIVGYTEDPYTIIMKYYENGSLEKWLWTSKTEKTKRVNMEFLKDISTGIKIMHEHGFVHPDIKPNNVLIDHDETSDRLSCVLTDFGISQLFSSKSLLVSGFEPVIINGASIQYASPEVIIRLRKKVQIVPKQMQHLDTYSFAIVMYELITRKRAFSKK